MQANALNGWREVLARIFAGFDAEYGLTPDWLVNPETHRRLKLDYFFREIAGAIEQRFGGAVDAVSLSGGYGVRQDVPPDVIQDIRRIPSAFTGYRTRW